MVIIGFFFAARALRAFARQNPEWSPVVTPLLVAYLLFALASWIADPLSNLVLRLNRYGRLALSRHEKLASNLVGGCLAGAALAALLLVVTRVPGWGVVAFAGVLMLIPISGA